MDAQARQLLDALIDRVHTVWPTVAFVRRPLSVGDPADVAVIENADGFAGLVGTVTPIVAK
jgi:hypothetical protein